MSDSTVSLRTNANIPEAGGGGTSSIFGNQSPIQAMDTMQQMQMRQTQVRTLQSQFNARQRAGQIIAAAPDFETGLTAIQKDPDVAGNAPDIIASLRGTQAIMTEMQGKQLGQNRDAVQMVLRGAAGAMNDPSSLGPLFDAGLQALPPGVRAQAEPAIRSYQRALTAGLGPQDGQKYQQRFQGALSGSGMDAPSVVELMGKPTLVQQGDVLTSALERAGQGVIPSGPRYAIGAAPRLEMVPQGNVTTPYSLSTQGSGPVGQSLPMGLAPSYQMTPVPGVPGALQPSIAGQGGITPLGVAGGNSLTGPEPAVRLGTGGPLGTSVGPQGPAATPAPMPVPTVAAPAGTTAAGTPSGGPAGSSPIPAPPPALGGVARTLTPGEKEFQERWNSAQVEIATNWRKEYEKASVGNANEINDDFRKDVTGISAMQPAVDNMLGAMSKFQAGGGADFRAGIAEMAQAMTNAGILKLSPETINKIGNDDLAAYQFFNANVKPGQIQRLKEVAQGTGRVMKSEVDTIMNAISASSDPRMLVGYFNQLKEALARGKDRAEGWMDYRADSSAGKLGNNRPEDYYTWYMKNKDPKIGEFLKPTSPTDVKGGNSGTPLGANTPGASKANPDPLPADPVEAEKKFKAMANGTWFVTTDGQGRQRVGQKGYGSK